MSVLYNMKEASQKSMIYPLQSSWSYWNSVQELLILLLKPRFQEDDHGRNSAVYKFHNIREGIGDVEVWARRPTQEERIVKYIP